MRRYPLLLVTVLATLVAVAPAQPPEVELPACNEEFARFLVEQQVAESRTVEQTDKRIRILIRSADFLWRFDEPSARSYFTEAFKFATDRFVEKGFEQKESKGLTMLLPDFRFEVIRAIAAKDSAWARRLIDQIMKEYEKAASDRKDFDRTRELDDILRVAVECEVAGGQVSQDACRISRSEELC